jgi:hypothetical protein
LHNCIYPIHYFTVFIFKDLLPNVEEVMCPKESFIKPFLQLISALAITKMGLPRIIGILELACTTDSVSRMRKSIG